MDRPERSLGLEGLSQVYDLFSASDQIQNTSAILDELELIQAVSLQLPAHPHSKTLNR